jgi:hypothetical protein
MKELSIQARRKIIYFQAVQAVAAIGLKSCANVGGVAMICMH